MTSQASETVRELSPQELRDILRRMWEIRLFEDKVYELLGENVIKGASHLYAGEEAVAVGAIAALRPDDLITSTHRGHGHCHARGDSLAETPEDRQEHLNKMMAELCGRATGYCRGRGGSMHIADVEKGNLGATGIVGGNIPRPPAPPSPCSCRARTAACCAFGDGVANTATSRGAERRLRLKRPWCTSWRTTSTACPCPLRR